MRSASTSFVVLPLLAVVIVGAPMDCEPPSKPIYDLENAPNLFEKFIKDYNKVYKNEADKKVHYEAFVDCLRTINMLNSDPEQSVTFEINEFADYVEPQRELVVPDKPASKPIYNLDEAPMLFEKFMKDHNKVYKNYLDKEEHYRAFVESLKAINTLNSDPQQSATYNINKFADYVEQQRNSITGLVVPEEAMD